MYAVLLSSRELHVIIASYSECSKGLCILRLWNNNLTISGGVINFSICFFTELILILEQLWIQLCSTHGPSFSCGKLQTLMDVCRFALEEEEYVEFSKLTQDRIIGTKGEIATVSSFLNRVLWTSFYKQWDKLVGMLSRLWAGCL